MGTVIASAAVSLDGFVADTGDAVGPLFDWHNNGTVDLWGTDPDRPFKVSPATAEYLNSYWPKIGAVVAGRRLFDITNGWHGVPPVGDHIVIVTHEPPTDWAYPDTPLHFTGSIEEGIAKAKELAGDRDVSLTAGNLTGQAIALGLVDEIAYNLVPVLFGTGRPFFGEFVGPQIMLDDPRVVQGDRVTHLHYRVSKG